MYVVVCVCVCTNWKKLFTYQLGHNYLGGQHVYIKDPEMHIGRHLSSEYSHRVSETSIYSCYLYVYFMVIIGRSVALSGKNFPRCEYKDTHFF